MKTQELFARTLQHCDKRGIKLTPLRLAVLKMLHSQSGPISAYDVLHLLQETQPQLRAMSVYRILSFLVAHHLVHRVTHCNGYTVCELPQNEHPCTQIILCECCGHTIEIALSALTETIYHLLQQHAFVPSSEPVEILGRCANCQASDATPRTDLVE